MGDHRIGRIDQAITGVARAQAPVGILGDIASKAANRVKDIASGKQVCRHAEALALDIGAIVEREDPLEGFGGGHPGLVGHRHDHCPARKVGHCKRRDAGPQPARCRHAVGIGECEDRPDRRRDAGVARRAGAALGRDHQRGAPGHYRRDRGRARRRSIVGDDHLEVIEMLRCESLEAGAKVGQILEMGNDDADLSHIISDSCRTSQAFAARGRGSISPGAAGAPRRRR